MAEGVAPGAQVYAFDEFEIDLASFTLRGPQGEIAIEPQVLALLTYFIQHPSVLVSKNELLDELWGHRFVSESALATQIKSLRRALGDDGRTQRMVKTVHGKGYRFAPDVRRVGKAASHPSETPKPTARNTNLGYERTKLIGRAEDMSRGIAALDDYRLVTLLGIGGSGKTRLAKAIGRAIQERYRDGVWFVDLVPVTDGAGIDTAIALALGVSVSDGGARSQIASAIRSSEVLIILDNCEHIEDEVAAALDYYLENTDGPDFLATSRDPIDLADEYRFFLSPLPVHSDEGMAPAVELFLHTAERHGYTDLQRDTEPVRQICEHLDGLPLALELAAAQLKQLTLEELLDRLDRRFEVLAGRQRVGVNRQDSLAQVVEDTWQLLDANEQILLGQLAVFPEQFTVTDVEEVFAGDLPNGISFPMSRLVELCLLSRTSDAGAMWRLLETVRLFALSKISTEAHQKNRERHAQWVLRRLGSYPDDHLHSLDQAKWSAENYSDLTAAERYFERSGRTSDAIEVCCAVGLMTQQDDGARASAKLARIDDYLAQSDDPLERAKLHTTAVLCAMVTRNYRRLATESQINLEVCLELDDPDRVATALILASLTNVLANPELSQAQLAEGLEAAERSGHAPTRDLVVVYQIWWNVMKDEFETATSRATEMVDRWDAANEPLRSPTYNAICALMACAIFRDPSTAAALADDLMDLDKSYGLWGTMILIASVYASNERAADMLQITDDIEVRVRRAGRSPWPELLLPAIVFADRKGERKLAARWLNAIVSSRRMPQTFHSLSVYQQLRSRLTEQSDSKSLGLDEAGAEALTWVRKATTATREAS